LDKNFASDLEKPTGDVDEGQSLGGAYRKRTQGRLVVASTRSPTPPYLFLAAATLQIREIFTCL
ncbi:8212_t:CDS:1, partial [Paraglomus brasilianum]